MWLCCCLRWFCWLCGCSGGLCPPLLLPFPSLPLLFRCLCKCLAVGLLFCYHSLLVSFVSCLWATAPHRPSCQPPVRGRALTLQCNLALQLLRHLRPYLLNRPSHCYHSDLHLPYEEAAPIQPLLCSQAAHRQKNNRSACRCSPLTVPRGAAPSLGYKPPCQRCWRQILVMHLGSCFSRSTSSTVQSSLLKPPRFYHPWVTGPSSCRLLWVTLQIHAQLQQVSL